MTIKMAECEHCKKREQKYHDKEGWIIFYRLNAVKITCGTKNNCQLMPRYSRVTYSDYDDTRLFFCSEKCLLSWIRGIGK